MALQIAMYRGDDKTYITRCSRMVTTTDTRTEIPVAEKSCETCLRSLAREDDRG